jgi:hypothetical protein
MDETTPNRLTGTLIRIRDEGFAFIHVAHQGDWYVNITSMRDRADWQEGELVSFIPGVAKGNKAAPAYDVFAVDRP